MMHEGQTRTPVHVSISVDTAWIGGHAPDQEASVPTLALALLQSAMQTPSAHWCFLASVSPDAT